MYCSAGSVGKPVLLKVHLDPEVVHPSDHVLQHPWAGAARIKVTGRLGISSLQEVQATCLGIFPEVLPAVLWLVRASSNS